MLLLYILQQNPVNQPAIQMLSFYYIPYLHISPRLSLSLHLTGDTGDTSAYGEKPHAPAAAGCPNPPPPLDALDGPCASDLFRGHAMP
jgi:hypothetical protein